MQILARILILMVLSFLTLFGLEILIGISSSDMTVAMPRAYQWHHGGFLWHKPGVSARLFMPEKFNWRLSYNSWGMRDRERATNKQGLRIAVLGDSYVEALELEDDQTVTRQLERRLGGDVEVLNFGMTGMGTLESFLVYEKLAKDFAPDLVVLFFYLGNDVRNNSLALEAVRNNLTREEQRRLRPYLVRAEGGNSMEISYPTSSLKGENSLVSRASSFLLIHLSIYRLIHDAVGGARVKSCPIKPMPPEISMEAPYGGKNLAAGVFLPPGVKVWDEAWLFTEEALVKLGAAVKSRGQKFLLVGIPYPGSDDEGRREMGLRYALDVGDDCKLNFMVNDLNYKIEFPKELKPVALPEGFEFSRATKRLRQIAERNEIEFVDLTDLFQRRRRVGAVDFFSWDKHWTNSGATAVADEMALLLRAQLKKDGR